MIKPKISIILPSINPNSWLNLYNQIIKSVGNFSFEVIACGPYFPDKSLELKSNFRFIRDFGCPSRCFMIASSIAEGKYITWFPDDCIIYENTLQECIDLLENKKELNNILTILYSEGPNYSNHQHLDPSYWISNTHQDLRLRHIKPDWKIAPIFLCNLQYLKDIGGIDCSFEHLNMNCHDLMYRIQSSGINVYMSPNRVFASNWKPWGEPKSPIQLAYELNDAPLFKKMYGGEENPTTRTVSFDNWRNSPAHWPRRFKIED